MVHDIAMHAFAKTTFAAYRSTRFRLNFCLKHNQISSVIIGGDPTLTKTKSASIRDLDRSFFVSKRYLRPCFGNQGY